MGRYGADLTFSRPFFTSRSSPTRRWAQAAAANLSIAVANLDTAFPGRIAGVVLEGLCGGEWFNLPTSPAAMSVADYSAEMQAEFCAAENLGGAASDVSCRLPTAAERDTPTLGNALLQWNSSQDAAARSFRYNRFLSQRVAGAISGLALAVKNISGGKSFTFAYNGYLFDLSDSRLTGSGHLDLSSLMSDENLDGIGSPYQYAPAPREPAGRFTSHGPVDSATLHKKVWVTEDDTRTVLTDKGAFDKHINTVQGTVNMIRRNMYSSMLHRHAMYWLDLASNGWWGRDDNATMIAATDAMWSNASHVMKQWEALLASAALQAPVLPPAEVAIFVDEVSAAARPVLGRGGTIPQGFPFETALQMHSWQDIAGIGAPVRVFLMGDLLHEDFPYGDLKLAVFLNAFMLTPELRQVIKTKLQTNGRTVAWLYAPGLLDAEACSGTGSGSCVPSIAASSELVGLQLELHVTAESLTTTFQKAMPALAGSSYGAGLGLVSPWLACTEGQGNRHGAEELVVLGRYGANAGAKASVCSSQSSTATSNFSAVFIGAPRPPLGFWRALAKNAGIHLYTDGSTTDGSAADGSAVDLHADTVEAAATGLLFHAGAGQQSGSRRVVQLPGGLLVTSEWGDVVCSKPCVSFLTPPLMDGESILYWVREP